MAQFPAFPLWTDAYLGDTGHLTTIEHGAYLLLLITMWRNKASLPDDDAKLCRYARMTKSQWLRIRPIIIDFFDIENGEITQGRLTDEYEAVRQLSKSQSKRAKARWLKNNKTDNAMASPRQCPSDASPTPTPTPNKELSPNGESKKVARRLPDDFVMPEEWINWATEVGWPEIIVALEVDKFTDYWRAAGGQNARKRDWLATWRNWMRKIPKGQGNGVSTETEAERSEKRVARALEILRERDNEGISGDP